MHMTKIMLVEDDKSLREIYGVRLLAEGYDIVSAGDGEEALAIAIKERPSLIVTDVMMPKISGFDMLDILRSTTETKDIKVIMMTALSSDDHRQRGEQMGADRYLVKSQVGIEDVVRVVHEVLGDSPGASGGPPPGGTQASPGTPPAPAPSQPSMPPAQPGAPAAPAQPQAAPGGPPAGIQLPPQQPPTQMAASYTPGQQTPQQPHDMPPISSTTPAAPSTRQRIIQPINAPEDKININDLLDRELAKEAGANMPRPAVPTVQQEQAVIQDQLQALGKGNQPSTPQISIDADGRVGAPAPRPAPQAPERPAANPTVPPRPEPPAVA